MSALRIFISYSHEDGLIAGELSNLLHAAFEPVLAEVFLDRTAISYGSSIKESINEALQRADILIAVMAGGQPASALSWPAFEIGQFTAYWGEQYQNGPHKDRTKGKVIGKVIVLTNCSTGLGPVDGQRPVSLGISREFLSDSTDPTALDLSRRAASLANDDLLDLIRDIEKEFADNQQYIEFKRHRSKRLRDLTAEFKCAAFDVLRNRIRHTSKPTKQLILRGRRTETALADDAKLFSVAGASDVFGRSETDTRIFPKSEEVAPGSTRYETTWQAFRATVKSHKYGDYWCWVIEQAVLGASREGTDLDPNLVLISNRDERYRIIATTVTTYFNEESEVSLYLIEALKRPDRGDPTTTKLFNCLNIICRFRFAFLEGSSPYYWMNFTKAAINGKSLLMELDYLKSEAIQAELQQPGAWKDFMTETELSRMVTTWDEVDLALRECCAAGIRPGVSSAEDDALTGQIRTHLKRIDDEIKPFNKWLGKTVSEMLAKVFTQTPANPVITDGLSGKAKAEEPPRTSIPS